MSALPHITMTGALVDLPEMRFTPGGKAVASFRLASNKRVRGADGKWENGDPIYLSVTAWDRLAENAVESLVRKGQRVTVEGVLEQQWWERDGQKQSKFVIVAESVSLDLMFSKYTERDGESRPAPASSGAAASDPWGTGPATDEPPF